MNKMEDNSLHGATIERLALTKTLHKLRRMVLKMTMQNVKLMHLRAALDSEMSNCSILKGFMS